MRHGKKFNHLGRKSGHRKATLRNLALGLITHKRINTTLAKAKALRQYIEPLVTKAKANTTHSRRVVFSYLQNKEAVQELFGPIATAVAERPGGYVRVIRLGFRKSDGAEMAMIEFVDFNDVYDVHTEVGGKKSRRRRRRGGSGSSSTATETAVATEEQTEATREETAETEEEEEADEAPETAEAAAEAETEEAEEEIEEEAATEEEAEETEEEEEEKDKEEK